MTRQRISPRLSLRLLPVHLRSEEDIQAPLSLSMYALSTVRTYLVSFLYRYIDPKDTPLSLACLLPPQLGVFLSLSVYPPPISFSTFDVSSIYGW